MYYIGLYPHTPHCGMKEPVMTFDNFAASQVGRALVAIIESPLLIAEYRTLSDEGRPALEAAAQKVAALIEALPTKEEQDYARRFCGYWVGQVMRGLGYRIVRERRRIRNSVIGEGAVWGVDPAAIRVLEELPADCVNRIELRVFSGPNGESLADWDSVQSVGKAVPFAAALASAKEYAAKCGFDTVVISGRQANSLQL
ncbi:hypothetical protein ACVIGB_000005 [Bradyrhizobium sp. USDA 4341]